MNELLILLNMWLFNRKYPYRFHYGIRRNADGRLDRQDAQNLRSTKEFGVANQVAVYNCISTNSLAFRKFCASGLRSFEVLHIPSTMLGVSCGVPYFSFLYQVYKYIEQI